MTFESLGLSPKMLETLAKKGFEEPTPIQCLAIPRLLVPGTAIAARARTGTGKTAAFGIPLIEKLSSRAESTEKRPPVSALILVPTRELAIQVTEEISSLKYAAAPKLACIYGGASITKQFQALRSGVDIVVGTPGRVLDHLERGTLDISTIQNFILDEADEMLDMGFIDDITKVMDSMNPQARIMLFSATLSAPVLSIVKKRTGAIEILEDSSETLPTELAEQVWIEVHERDRIEALSRIIDSENEFYGIVFVATKIEADTVAKRLGERGYLVEALHGDLSQEARERVLGKFRDKRVTILVATDVAARGIDIEKLTHVINWELPHDSDEYLHRIGRTGRAGNTGTAITFVTPEEYHRLFRIRKVSGTSLKKGSIPEVEGILNTQKERIESKILAHAGETPAESPIWQDFARELLAKLSPEEALAAALAEGFSSQLDPGKYRELTEVSVDDTGITRLYIGEGRRDGLDPRALVTKVKKLSGLSDRQIGSVEVYENFSFVSVPYREAEKIIAITRAKGGMPKVQIAAPKGAVPGAFHGGSAAGGVYPRKRASKEAALRRVASKGVGHAEGPSRKYKPRRERKAKKQ
ncbi:MAG: DEAD/DEAH box helicase [Spirochaetaceae bacterium]|nr:DEAD/DEAH box helicase [Spirochaetaceae bacterium]